jgi:fucose 4-O-acetylase-like acetyltransferase
MISITNFIISTIQFIMYGFIIYYMNYLTQKDCICKIDWRHEFITIYAWVMIVFLFLKYYLFDNITETDARKIDIYNSYLLIKTIIPITDIIHIYAFFTYVTDINKSKTCMKCLSKNLKKTNAFMERRKYIFVIIYVITLIIVVFPIKKTYNDIIKLL